MPVLLFHHFCHEKDWDQGLVNSAAFEKNIIEILSVNEDLSLKIKIGDATKNIFFGELVWIY